MTDSQQRAALVAEACSWKATSYHKRARIKGVGCDCFTFLFELLRFAGLIPELEIEELERTVYSDDWFCHASEERYLLWVMKHVPKILEATCSPSLRLEPGNIVLTRCVGSPRFNHGGIVVQWPKILHAIGEGGVCESNASTHWMWASHDLAVFDPFRGQGTGVRD